MDQKQELISVLDDVLTHSEIPQDTRNKLEQLYTQMVDENDQENPQGDQQSFMDGYNSLRDVVATLKQMQEPDVDAVIPLIETGMKAFKKCEDRITKVENYLASMEQVN